MKKLLISLLMMISLVGCSEVKNAKEWATECAFERYDEYFGGFGLTAYHIEKYKVNIDDYEQDIDFNKYSAEVYQFDFIDGTGESHVFNVMIVFKRFNLGVFKESFIADCEVELQ